MTYAAPALEYHDLETFREPVILWVVFIGFAVFLITVYAIYCRAIGGQLDVDLTWHGFRLTCAK